MPASGSRPCAGRSRVRMSSPYPPAGRRLPLRPSRPARCPDARPSPGRGRQVRGGRLHRVRRSHPDLRGDHGRPPEPDRARAGRAHGSGRAAKVGWEAVSELLAIGISHKTAPIELRERVALTDGMSERFLRELVAAPDIHEAVALSTCNRTEVYVVTGDPVEAESAVLGMLARQAGIRP